MKEYISKFTNKLNQLISEHPDADLRFHTGSLDCMCGCKVLDCDVNYIEKDNTIYIG